MADMAIECVYLISVDSPGGISGIEAVAIKFSEVVNHDVSLSLPLRCVIVDRDSNAGAARIF